MEYTRLPGKTRTFLGWYSLWLGGDHLLAVENRGYSERYQRYYFKDVQAFIIRRTHRGKVWNVVFSILISLMLLGAYATADNDSAALIAWSIPTAIFTFLLIYNMVKGPTCNCWVKVPLGTSQLPALARVKRAQKVLAKIKPLLEQVQGYLPREELVGRLDDKRSAAVNAVVMAPEQKLDGGLRLHMTLFSLLLIDGCWTIVVLYFNNSVIFTVNVVISLALFFSTIAGVARQGKKKLSAGAKGLAWGTLALAGTSYIFGYVYAIFFAITSNPAGFKSQSALIGNMTQIKPLEHKGLALFLIIYSVMAIIMGIMGLYFTTRSRTAPVEVAQTDEGGQVA